MAFGDFLDLTPTVSGKVSASGNMTRAYAFITQLLSSRDHEAVGN